MAREDSRRYSSEQIAEMNRTGDFVATPADAPSIDFDEVFWSELEDGNFTPVSQVELLLEAETLDSSSAARRIPRAEMSRILDAYVRARGKKAS